MALAQHIPPTNLPTPLTSFVGREREIGEVRRLLSGTRLLTLTGAGGCGKSRLAFEVAARGAGDFQDGVWLVELAARSNDSLVPQAVASALAVPDRPGVSIEDALADHLGSKSLLLVLDNCEHLLSACAGLADALLRACSRLRILVTSREALGVPGETIWRVPSLSVPDLRHLPPADRIAAYEAVQLFVERAASAQSGFRITESNAAPIAQICARLDGMPLAIELAAARSRALTAEQIAARLDDRFQLLTGGSRTVLPQHRTLRAAMDWSYDLLTEQERLLLPRLSAFADGWTLEAAEAVCAGSGITATGILDLLAQLVDKSLITAETQGAETRYRLLETVRQYARELLEEAGLGTPVRRRHRDWYLKLAEQAGAEMWSSVQAMWLKRLEAEHDNFRAALRWCRTEADGAEAELRLAAALMWFWFIHGDIREGLDHLDAALARGRDAPAAGRAKALCGAGILAWRYDEYDRARPLLDESLALFRDLSDTRGTAVALHFVAHLAETRGEFARAAAQFEEGLTYYRRINDAWGIGKSLSCLGSSVLHQGDYKKAEALIDEGLPYLRKAGDLTHTVGALARLAALAQRRGDHERAKTLAGEALRNVREIGHSAYVYGTLRTLGLVALRNGECASAVSLFVECLALTRQLGDREGIARTLESLAEASLAQRDPARAARLFGSSERIREVIKYPLPPGERADRAAHLAALRDALGEEGLATAWAAGKAMELDEAIDCGLTSPGPTIPAAREKSPLTAREHEVAALVAQGLTNREIAARLVIAERTAEGHVQSILNKLAFNCRAQIAAWAVEHGLRVPSA